MVCRKLMKSFHGTTASHAFHALMLSKIMSRKRCMRRKEMVANIAAGIIGFSLASVMLRKNKPCKCR